MSDDDERKSLREFLWALKDCFGIASAESADGRFRKAYHALLKISFGHLYAFCRHEPDQTTARGRDADWFRSYLGSLRYGDVTGAERWRQLLSFVNVHDAEMYFPLKAHSPFAGKVLLFADKLAEGGAVFSGENRDLLELVAKQQRVGEYVVVISPKSVVPTNKKQEGGGR